jgi:hypothetical protein
MEDISLKVKSRRQQIGLQKIKKMSQDCKKEHLLPVARYLYLYIKMFPQALEEHQTLSLIKDIEFKMLNIKEYYE